MITSLAPIISPTGITAPSFQDCLEFLQAQYRAIYGQDVYLEPDSQDGQWIAIQAQGYADCGATLIAIYNSFSPATAQYAALSNNVKINGIRRAIATYSTVSLLLTGQVGTTINQGVVQDSNGIRWNLPLVVVIPQGGQITVTATCANLGAVPALAGTITIIRTPTLGWQTVTNPTNAVPGSPVEKDGPLRARQAISTSLPSQSILDGIRGAVASVSGVTRSRIYENDGSGKDANGNPMPVDANGQPPKTISVTVEGGDDNAVARAIALKKGPGCGTYGTTKIAVIDASNNQATINYFRPTYVAVAVAISINPLPGYTNDTGDRIKSAVANYISGLGIGAAVMLGRLYVPANLPGIDVAATFELLSVKCAAKPNTPQAADVAIAFNQIATCAVTDIQLTVSSGSSGSNPPSTSG